MRRKNRGSTLVEVMVGFAILMILAAGVTRLIHLSSEMLADSKDMLQGQNSFTQQLYKNNHGSLTTSEIKPFTVILQETDSTGENKKSGGASITLDHAKTEKISDEESEMTVYQFQYDATAH
jgi:Tfp pilus assembly protein PilE